MAVDAVTRRDVAARLVAITRANGSIVAARARGALSTFYVWAMGNGLAETNPVIGTLKPQDAQPRSRVLGDEELTAIWRASGNDAYGRVIKLLILTGARRGEVGGMRWSELDLDRAIWTIPPQRTKNNRPHALPLMPISLDVITGVPPRRVGTIYSVLALLWGSGTGTPKLFSTGGLERRCGHGACMTSGDR
jgi:integrase